MTRPAIAILLEFGFHDIKKYIHSGFAAKLSKKIDIVWLAIDKNSPEFDSYFKETGFPLIYFKEADFPFPVLKIENINHTVRSSWMLKKNVGTFHNYKKVNKKRFSSFILGNNILKSFLEKRTLYRVKSYYKSPLLEKVFKENNIKYILGTGYGSVYCRCAYVTAYHLSIKTFFLIGSWKDLYVNNFIPFDFLDRIYVWSDHMKRSYLSQMPYLKEKSVIVSGNPTFDLLKTSRPEFDRQFYSSKYKISQQADWLLYTMMPPVLVKDEIETAILLAKELLKKYKPEEKSIILRRNPNHSKDDYNDRHLPPNLILADHYCTYDKEKDMIVQSPEGEKEWIDLLNHCSINLSVPSTVALEFLALNKSVINIGFGPDGNPNEHVRQHFEAGFYKPLFGFKKVFASMTLNHFLPILEKAKVCDTNNSDYMTHPSDLASDYIIDNILHI